MVNAGLYSVLVSNEYGAVISGTAELEVLKSTLKIINQQKPEPLTIGEKFLISADIQGAYPITAKLYKDNIYIKEAIYDSMKDVALKNGLVAYYPFNGNANDESGNGYDGEINGATLTEDRFGSRDMAYSFSDHYILLDDGLKEFAPTSSQGLTFSFWAKANSAGYVITQYRNMIAGLSNFFIHLNKPDLGVGGFNLSGNGTSTFSGTIQGESNDWNHWVIEMFPGENNVKVSRNGILEKQGRLTFNGSTSSTQFQIGTIIGSRYPGPLYGQIDEVRIYNRTLSKAEVAALYHGKMNVSAVDDKIKNIKFSIYSFKHQDFGDYQVIYSNKFGEIKSETITPVLENTPPVIIDQSSSVIVDSYGEKVQLRVKVSGSFPVFYKWYKDGVLVDGQIDELFIIENVAEDSEYKCIVTNQFGEIESAIITVGLNRLKWAFKTRDSVRASPAIGNDGTIYVGSYDNNLYAINPDGSKKWAFDTGDNVNSSPAIGSDGTIYVGSDDNNLYAINPDGSKKWAFETGDDVWSSPAIGSDGTIYVGSNDNNLYAINPDGSKKWAFKTGDLACSSPAIGSNGTIYIGSIDNNLYAINPDGTWKWSFKTGSYVPSSPAIGSDGTIYVASYDNYLYAIKPDGSKKWAFKTGDLVWCSPAIGSDGTIYVGSLDKKLYAISPEGSKKWGFKTSSFKTGSHVNPTPAIGSDGTIYVGSSDKYLYAINPNGKRKWRYYTGDNVYSSPAIGSDGTIYVGSDGGNLYAINTSSFGPSNSSWPMFRGNQFRDGNRPTPPKIIRVSGSGIFELGHNIEFSVEAKGRGLDFRWYNNNEIITGAHSPTLKLQNVIKEDEGQYKVEVSNKYGKVVSEIISIEVKAYPPTITQQPEDKEIHHGEDVEFHIASSGSHPIEFQWYKNGKQIKGATDTTLKLDDATKEDEAIYSVKITNDFGIARSRIAQLIVRTDPPSITMQPKDHEVYLGADVEFSVTATGSGILEYHWYKNGVQIEGATEPIFRIPFATNEDIDIYSVRIKNSFGKSYSRIAQLKLKKVALTLNPPTIDSSGRLVLTANGPPNRKVIFQFSNDLVKWNDQLTLPLSNGTTTFNVPIQSSPNAPNLFYRLKLVE
ncbi:PQQ-binding-like beta-propeller repeat protein [bacterium]|nr:PQQ-binding-like beta-propeller repeat protein [bacterium]